MELLLPEVRKLQSNRFPQLAKIDGLSYKIVKNEGSSREKGNPGLKTVLSRIPSVIPLFAALIF